jgi:hypothetical protein
MSPRRHPADCGTGSRHGEFLLVAARSCLAFWQIFIMTAEDAKWFNRHSCRNFSWPRIHADFRGPVISSMEAWMIPPFPVEVAEFHHSWRFLCVFAALRENFLNHATESHGTRNPFLHPSTLPFFHLSGPNLASSQLLSFVPRSATSLCGNRLSLTGSICGQKSRLRAVSKAQKACNQHTTKHLFWSDP